MTTNEWYKPTKLRDSYRLNMVWDPLENLKRSRSGKWPKLKRPKYRIPSDAIADINFQGVEMNISVKDSSKVDISVPIEGRDDTFLGDAVDLARDALAVWEQEFKRLIK